MKRFGDGALAAATRPLHSPEVCTHLFDTPQFRIGYHEVVVKANPNGSIALDADTGTVVCRLDGWFDTEKEVTNVILTSAELGADAREQQVRSDGSFATDMMKYVTVRCINSNSFTDNMVSPRYSTSPDPRDLRWSR